MVMYVVTVVKRDWKGTVFTITQDRKEFPETYYLGKVPVNK